MLLPTFMVYFVLIPYTINVCLVQGRCMFNNAFLFVCLFVRLFVRWCVCLFVRLFVFYKIWCNINDIAIMSTIWYFEPDYNCYTF